MPSTPAPHRQHYNITLLVLTFAGIAFALQQTLIIPALPTLQRDFHTSTAWVTWLLTIFLLSSSVLTPILGKLGDQYGKERLLVVSLGLFLLGSLAGIAAPNIATLIACRALQGAGAAVFPLSFAIIRDEFPPEKVAVGMGLVSSVFGVGGALGIVLSGVIVDNTSWRWLFAVGAVGTAIAMVLVQLFVPESPIKTPSRVDYVGALLLSLGLVLLLVPLTEGDNWGWGSVRTVGMLVASGALLFAWGRYELRTDDPMVPMRMLGERTVLLTNIAAVLAGFAMFGSFILVPNFVEMPRGLPPQIAHLVHYGFGASATKAGLYMLPGALGGLVGGPIAGLLGRRFGSKWPLAMGMALTAFAVGWLAAFHDHPWQIVVGMAFVGIGVPFAFASMPKLVSDAVAPSETGIANAMNTVMRTMGGVIGGQIGAALLTAHVLAGTHGIPSESGYAWAFWLACGGALIGVVVALLIPRAVPVAQRTGAAPH